MKAIPSFDNLNERFQQLNTKDKHHHLNDMKQTLNNWSPSKEHLETLQSSTNEPLLSDLDYMSALYKPPLSSIRRIHLRNKLLEHFNKANKAEQQYIYTILQYYQLLDD